jgi:hypothetical protein
MVELSARTTLVWALYPSTTRTQVSNDDHAAIAASDAADGSGRAGLAVIHSADPRTTAGRVHREVLRRCSGGRPKPEPENRREDSPHWRPPALLRLVTR